ncbi:MAG TPA: hypothetical protein DCS93_13440 [Microscillaceae bacterium]|nr:hypothetical protein [Microscillaceae bacterium]
MNIANLLTDFYLKNGIPDNGGSDDTTFKIKILGLKLELPNPKFRREATYIHDIHHVLNNCDTSWKGEGFISGWEVATGIWKYFPVGLLSLWAMGYSLWLYPIAVFNGFKKGKNNTGVINLGLAKAELMKMEMTELIRLTSKQKDKLKKNQGKKSKKFLQLAEFLGWSLITQLILFFPLIIVVLGILFA